MPKPFPNHEAEQRVRARLIADGYQPDRRFHPSDPAEHEAICEDKDSYNGVPIYDLQDNCTCGAAYMSHYNGHCPK